MTHPDEGQIQAFLDEEPTGQERAAIAEHLMVCGACRSTHDELRRAKGLMATCFPLLDGPAPAVERRPTRSTRRAPLVSAAMIRAAELVLFMAAAAAAAVPGSPVREWVVQIADRTEIVPVDAPEAVPVVPRGDPLVPAAVVTGTVRGSRGEPLAFARVSVVGDTLAAWADELGAYHIEGTPREQWRIRATHPGHEPEERSARLPDSGQLSLDFSLHPRPGPMVDPLADFQPFDIAYTLPALLNTAQVTAAIEARYPPDLVDRQVGGEAVLRIWVDENGRVARSALARSSGQPRLDAIALTVSRDMRFRPAMTRDDRVRVIVHIPVVFAPERADAGS